MFRPLLLLSLSLSLSLSMALAPSAFTFLSPRSCPDTKGCEVLVRGRNTFFFAGDFRVLFGVKAATEIRVVQERESAIAVAPPCSMCGTVPVTIIEGSRRISAGNFTYISESSRSRRGVYSITAVLADDCYGPVMAPAVPAIPKAFSRQENCTGER
jgi:hypothetical protein